MFVRKSKYALSMAAMIMAVQLTACSKPADVKADSSAAETTALAAESSADETTAAIPETTEETEAATVTHTIGIINIDLPEYFSAEDMSQTVMGTDVKMLTCSEPKQKQNIMILYTDTGEDNSETYDIEAGLQSGLDNMIANAKAQVGSASIESETETQQVEFAGRTWGHRNAVVSAGREKINLDMYATAEVKQGVAIVAFMNMGGTNEDFTNRLDNIIAINEQ